MAATAASRPSGPPRARWSARRSGRRSGPGAARVVLVGRAGGHHDQARGHQGQRPRRRWRRPRSRVPSGAGRPAWSRPRRDGRGPPTPVRPIPRDDATGGRRAGSTRASCSPSTSSPESSPGSSPRTPWSSPSTAPRLLTTGTRLGRRLRPVDAGRRPDRPCSTPLRDTVALR